jgi:hypothetical protein
MRIFNIRLTGRIAAGHVELLARREHLLNRAFPRLLVEHALAVGVVVNTPRNVPAPGNSTPMPGTCAISRTLRVPSLLSTIAKFTSSPLGLSGQTSAAWWYSPSVMPQRAGAVAVGVVGTHAAVRGTKRMAAMPASSSSHVSTSTNTMPLTPSPAA